MTTLIVSPSAAPEHELDFPLRPKSEPPQTALRGGASRRAEKIANTLVLAILFAAPALMCVHFAVVNDPDVWWHLSIGQWILQHHAVPQVDLFSASLAGKPWQAYSWLFEVIVAKLFQSLGMVGIVTYTSVMILAITASLYHLVRRLQSDFSFAVLITFVAGYSIGHLYTPRPWLFTILFFILELDILMHARRTGRLRELAWLPVIFALWANLHIQFIYGLFVLGVALAEAVLARRNVGAETSIRPAWMGGALLASILATLLNPFGWHIYAVAYGLATQTGALDKVTELQSIPFRDLCDFTILLLALGCAAALAWQRRFVFFESGLLAFAAAVSFRSRRDIWVLAMVAAAILASRIVSSRKTAVHTPRFSPALALVAAALVLFAGFRTMKVSNSLLQEQQAETLPVRAVEIIRAKGYSGPIYNNFDWGGYLIWALHMPVSVDGRQNLYGDQRIDRSVATWDGEPDWASDPALKLARLVIGPVKLPLIQLLRTDSHFQLVCEDKVSAVFVARR